MVTDWRKHFDYSIIYEVILQSAPKISKPISYDFRSN